MHAATKAFRHLAAIGHENVLSVVLIGGTAATLLLAFAPSQIVGDTWMTLVAGREVAHHGLPATDELTVFGEDRTWTNQQWLAHIVAYGSWRVAGLPGVVLVGIAAVTTAYCLGIAAARRRGASALACALVLVPVLVAAPWSWTIRAQVYVLPLFVATVWIACAARRRVSPATLCLLPLLVLWSNLHGSVLLGVAIAVMTGLLRLVSRDAGRRERLLGGILVLVSPLTLFATPYAPGRIFDYYRMFIFDPPFDGLLVEWQRTGWSSSTAAFWTLAAATVLLALVTRRNLSLLEGLILALTAWGAIQAVRGIVWFALACLVIAPALVTRVVGDRRVLRLRAANLALAAIVCAFVFGGVGALIARGDAPLERRWPYDALPTFTTLLADPQTRVWGTDGHADWLLWNLPDLRGRIAFDIRFEIFARSDIEASVRWKGRQGPDWAEISDPYDVIVLAAGERTTHLAALRKRQGLEERYANGDIIVLSRSRSVQPSSQ